MKAASDLHSSALVPQGPSLWRRGCHGQRQPRCSRRSLNIRGKQSEAAEAALGGAGHRRCVPGGVPAGLRDPAPSCRPHSTLSTLPLHPTVQGEAETRNGALGAPCSSAPVAAPPQHPWAALLCAFRPPGGSTRPPPAWVLGAWREVRSPAQLLLPRTRRPVQNAGALSPAPAQWWSHRPGVPTSPTWTHRHTGARSGSGRPFLPT